MIYKLELILILIITFVCFTNTFTEGYTIIKTDMVIGITNMVLSGAALFLGFAYYLFYKLLD